MSWILNFLSGFPNWLNILFMAALPVIELRGAIPLGIAMGEPPLAVLIYSLVGSMVPVPFILWLFHKVTDLLRTIEIFRKLVDLVIHRTLKNREKIDRYGFIGLIILVIIPLPGTGVWTGSFLASLLELDSKRAFVAILIGDLLAGLIVLALSLGAVSFI